MHSIDVFHRELTNELDERGFSTYTLDWVATVKIPEGMSVEDGLEYAYRWTQNTDGSWSRRIGNDSNPNVVCYKTKQIKGRIYGLRSSMVGDVFVVDSDMDQQYKVAMFGFEHSPRTA